MSKNATKRSCFSGGLVFLAFAAFGVSSGSSSQDFDWDQVTSQCVDVRSAFQLVSSYPGPLLQGARGRIVRDFFPDDEGKVTADAVQDWTGVLAVRGWFYNQRARLGAASSEKFELEPYVDIGSSWIQFESAGAQRLPVIWFDGSKEIAAPHVPRLSPDHPQDLTLFAVLDNHGFREANGQSQFKIMSWGPYTFRLKTGSSDGNAEVSFRTLTSPQPLRCNFAPVDAGKLVVAVRFSWSLGRIEVWINDRQVVCECVAEDQNPQPVCDWQSDFGWRPDANHGFSLAGSQGSSKDHRGLYSMSAVCLTYLEDELFHRARHELMAMYR